MSWYVSRDLHLVRLLSYTLKMAMQLVKLLHLYRVLINSNIGLFYYNFLILTPTFSKVPKEKYGKTPNFSRMQHFYSHFQNLSENSVIGTLKSVLRRKYRLLVHIVNINQKNIYEILLNAMFLQCKN